MAGRYYVVAATATAATSTYTIQPDTLQHIQEVMRSAVRASTGRLGSADGRRRTSRHATGTSRTTARPRWADDGRATARNGRRRPTTAARRGLGRGAYAGRRTRAATLHGSEAAAQRVHRQHYTATGDLRRWRRSTARPAGYATRTWSAPAGATSRPARIPAGRTTARIPGWTLIN